MKIIIIKTLPNKNYKHFIHYMQYLYWIADIILNKPSRTYYVVEPKNKSNGIYPKNPQLMESEYIDNRELVSKIGKESIKTIIEELFKRKVSQLGKYKKMYRKDIDCPFNL